MSDSDKRVNCFKCKHYQVTWDQAQPRGCKFYNFKSREMPSLLVARNSGDSCMAYEEKVKASKEKDLNDPIYW